MKAGLSRDARSEDSRRYSSLHNRYTHTHTHALMSTGNYTLMIYVCVYLLRVYNIPVFIRITKECFFFFKSSPVAMTTVTHVYIAVTK